MYMRLDAVCAVCSINKISGRPSFKSLCLKCRQEEIRKRSVSTSFFFLPKIVKRQGKKKGPSGLQRTKPWKKISKIMLDSHVRVFGVCCSLNRWKCFFLFFRHHHIKEMTLQRRAHFNICDANSGKRTKRTSMFCAVVVGSSCNM